MPINSELLARIVHAEIGSMDIADYAANDRAKVDMARLKVRDKGNPDIIIGHLLIVACYGSEQAILQVQDAIRNAVGAEAGNP